MRKSKGLRKECVWPVQGGGKAGDPGAMGLDPSGCHGKERPEGQGGAGTQGRSSHVPALPLGSPSIQPAASWAKPWVPVGTSASLHVALHLSACCWVP